MILVTGATGVLGGHVVRELRRQDRSVRALVRKGSDYFWLNDTGASYFFGDLRDASSLQRACSGIRAIVACSGVNHETSDNDHARVTVAGHANLWTAARECGVEHVVYVSALGVDRGYESAWFEAKTRAEASLVEFGLGHTILRPAPFTRAFAELARRTARTGTMWVPGPGTNRVAPLAPSTMASYAIAALERQDWRNRVIDLSGRDVLTGREALTRAIEKHGGTGTPHFLADGMARAIARAARPIGRRWENRMKHLNRWFTDDFVVSMDGVVAETGIAPISFDDAIEQDLQQILPLEDRGTWEERIVHQRFDATIYEPGEAHVDSLPAGPLRYDRRLRRR